MSRMSGRLSTSVPTSAGVSLRRRLVLHGHRQPLRIAPVPLPQAEHQAEDADRDEQADVREEEVRRLARRRRPRDDARVPGDRDGDALAEVEDARRLDGDVRADDRRRRRRLLRAVPAGEGVRPQARDGRRQVDDGPGALDGHVPLVAGDVPVELVVLVEELQAVAHAVAAARRSSSRPARRAPRSSASGSAARGWTRTAAAPRLRP